MTSITPAEPPDDKLPDNFDPFEHLQKIYIPQHNALVKRYFSDLGNDWKPNIASSRSALRVACTMTDNDNQLMMNLRHHLLFDLLGYGRKNLAIFYGSRENQEQPVEGHPKIVFYFSQDSESLPSEQDYKADAEYSVRLMQLENTSSNLRTKLVEIANEIKVQFLSAGKGIILTKGNLCVSYKDVKNGFPNGSKILTNTEADAIDIYQRICNVVDVTFNEQKITVGNPKKLSTTGQVTETQIIMGKTRKKRAYRRVVNVRFRYAYALIPGEPQPVFLIDTTYRYTPLVKI
ncbi:hypothetical protein FACHB389_15705 [Nostoc calcicola FACHB-389]|nr:hypothetical protein [Nostoc calcicola FACHB-3891]OKH34493.1 hypothetical protein FACHB389_15705 [Nostoc calcicola FACHB-389]